MICLELKYGHDKDGTLTDVRFDGLHGREHVSSVKEALGVLKIRNPAVGFTKDCKAGRYDDISDAEYDRLLKSIETIAQLWHYPDDPENKSAEYGMNPLTLLANAIETITRLHASLRDVQARGGADIPDDDTV